MFIFRQSQLTCCHYHHSYLIFLLKSLCPDPDDDEIVLQLVQALVGSVGSDVLDPAVTGSFHLLKAVVARVSVEIYMQLDGIQPDNVSL